MRDTSRLASGYFINTHYSGYLDLVKHQDLQIDRISDPEYVNFVESRGFLVGGSCSVSVFSKAPFSLFALDNEKVIGVIRLDGSYEDNDNISWLPNTEEFQKIWNQRNWLEIGVVAVDYAYSKKGIATELFTRALLYMKENRMQNLFSVVVLTPNNEPSHKWHLKHGFVPVANYSVPLEFGVENYKSRLYYRKV